MKVRYFVLKQKNPYSQIYIRFWNGRKYDFKTSTGLQVQFKDWNEKDEKVRNKVTATDKDFINSKLLELEAFVIENFNIEYNTGQIIGKDWLKTKVNSFFNRVDDTKPEKIYFIAWIDEFIKTAPKRLNKSKPISERTILAYKSILNNFKEYEAFKKLKLKHSDINTAFYFDLIDYFRTEKKYSENTIGNQIKYLKFFCGKIEIENLPIPKDYKNGEFVKPKETATDIYLTTAEIEKIFKFDFSNKPYLDNARDLLIIGLNTGLRISDFMRLDLSHIKKDTIQIKAQKTGKIAEIPINKQIELTLNKQGGALPHPISEQKFNEYLKELGELIGFNEPVNGAKMVCINEDEATVKGTAKVFRKVSGTLPKYELMTSHICRRSFATNLYGQIPTPVIMAITGHATETQFLTYIKKTAAENAEVLRNFYKRKAEENGLEFNLKVI